LRAFIQLFESIRHSFQIYSIFFGMSVNSQTWRFLPTKPLKYLHSQI
jgi:hypothetical protein